MTKLSDTSAKHNKRQRMRQAAWLLLTLLCAVIVVSLTGCATQSESITLTPAPCPTLSPPPVLSQPIPSETYSQSVQQRLQSWRERLTVTPRTR